MAEDSRTKDAIDRLSKAVESLSAKIGGGGTGGGTGGGGRTSSGGGVGGVIGSLLGGGAKAAAGGLAGGFGFSLPGGGATGLAATAVAKAVELAVPVIGGGLIQSSRGGSFGAGAVGAINQIAAGIPIIGELSGASGVQRVTEGATSDLNAATDNVARFAGVNAISPAARQLLARQFKNQNMQIEANREANQVVVNEQMFGNGVGGVLDTAKTINHMVTQAGFRQHGG